MPRNARVPRGRARGEPTALSLKLKAMNMVMPKSKWNIVTGDKVQVMSGKDKGKQEVVQRVIHAENRLFVKGLNLHSKAIKARGEDGIVGGIVEREAPIHYSKVMLLDPASITDGWPDVLGTPTRYRIGWTAEGQRVRVSVKSGAVIEKPQFSKKHRAYTDGPKDTPQEEAAKLTKPPRLGLRALLQSEE
jgi:large subunit ribosomal protein L24